MDLTSQKSTETHISELQSLAEKFLPGTCWKLDKQYHQVESICMDISTAHAKTKKITFDIVSDVDYICDIGHGLFFSNDIKSAIEVSKEEYEDQMDNVSSFLINKQNLLIERSCLLNPITEFSDLESVENFISSNAGRHNFAYQPTADTFRIFNVDSSEYIGQDMTVIENHFHLSATKSISRIREIKFSHIGNRTIFYITKYQFDELLKIIKIDERI